MTIAYEIHALPPALLDTVRATGRDASGHPVERMTAGGGEPLRCCAGPDPAGGYPAAWRTRPQVLRAYDERGWIHPAPGVVQVHSRNVAYGCYMFTVTPEVFGVGRR